jgi:hypothetical protein
MTKTSKAYALLLTLLITMSCLTLLTIKPVNAQPVAKLPVPEFAVQYTDHSYEAPASTSIDPFTGQTIENPSKHIDNRTLQFTIKNQAIDRGNLHFIIAMKVHFSPNWTTIYNGWVAWEGDPNSSIPEPRFIVWQFSTLKSNNVPGEAGRFYHDGDSFYLPSEGQVDFQVKAQTWGEVMATTSAQNPFGGSITTLFGESDWSAVHTIKLSDGASGSVDASSSPTPTPTVPELYWLIIVPLLLSLFAVAVIIKRRKKDGSLSYKVSSPIAG